MTIESKKHTIFMGADVSPEELRGLAELGLQGRLGADESWLLELLKTEGVDAYTGERNFKKCRQKPFFQEFFQVGNALRAAARASMLQGAEEIQERKAQRWLVAFCAWIPGFLAKRDAERRDREARDLQCSEQCGRDRRQGTHSPGAKRTASAVTKKIELGLGQGSCKDCPRKYADVEVQRYHIAG